VVDRDADRLAHLPLAHQVQALEAIVRSNPVVAHVLDRVPALNLGSWYEQRFHRPLAPYRSVEHAIATWPTTASSVGVRCDGDAFVVCAPFGLADLFAMVVRANTTLVDEPVYRAKAERWWRTWPQVTVLPWPLG
jgi:hypothetical protein